MSARVAAFPWSQTSLGARTDWPDELITAANIVLESAFPNLLMVSDELIICAYNDAYLPLLGAKPEALGRSFLDVWAEARNPLEDNILDALDGRSRYFENGRFELDRHGRLEPAYFDYCFSPVRLHNGTIIGVLNTAIETTPRVHAEQRIRTSEHELRLANEQKNRFLAILGHELRNPLAALTSTLATRRAAVDAETAADSDTLIRRQIERLSRLTDDLQHLTRYNQDQLALHVEPLDLAELLRSSAIELTDMLEGNDRRLVLDLAPGPLPVVADPARIAQVLSNLAHNAQKFSPPGGRIELRSQRINDHAEIVIADDGMGIEPSRLESIFHAFEQGGPEYGQGFGIGLTLVKALIELHGGTVCAVSQGPGTGSAFHLTLPLTPATAPAPVSEASETPPAADRRPARRRILLIEDDVSVAESLALLLESLDQSVRIAPTGEDGIRAATDFGPDLILIDRGLPDLDGERVAARLRANHAGQACPRLVAVTGWNSGESEPALFDEYLLKPVAPEDIEALLFRNRSTPPS